MPLEAIEDSVTVENYEAGTDYDLFYNNDALVLEVLPEGKIPDETAKLTIGFNKVDASLITKADIIGGYDISTKTTSGLELLDSVFPKFAILPDIILCPGFSHDSEVAALMSAKAASITTSEGGADWETDEAFYERLRDSMETFSTAGPIGAYIYWAKTASAKITDVKPSSPEPGVVDIRVLLENGEMPDEEMLALVLKAVNADKTRPFTDFVQVSAPDIVTYDLDITYYLPKLQENSAIFIQSEVMKAVAEYKSWQSAKMGRDINPDELVHK